MWKWETFEIWNNIEMVNLTMFLILDGDGQKVNPGPALKRGPLGSPGFTAFIPVINHGGFCGAG